MADEEKNVEQAEAQQPVDQTIDAPQAEEAAAQQPEAPAEAAKPSELDQAKADADEQLKLNLYVLTRDENSGCATFENDVTIVSAVGDAFPVFFALIAALVCTTTMTRMTRMAGCSCIAGTFKKDEG